MGAQDSHDLLAAVWSPGQKRARAPRQCCRLPCRSAPGEAGAAAKGAGLSASPKEDSYLAYSSDKMPSKTGVQS